MKVRTLRGMDSINSLYEFAKGALDSMA